MRILAVQESDWVDRNPVLHHRMLEALSLQGHEVTVIDFDVLWHRRGLFPLWQARREIRDCHKFFADAVITVIRPAMLRVRGVGRLSWLIANRGELARLFRQWKPDVVVAYGISNAFLALRLSRKHGTPFVYHLLDALHTLAEPRVLRPIARAVERSVMRRANKVIAVNNRLGSYAVDMGAEKSRVEIIPMGTNAAVSIPSSNPKVRDDLGIAPTDFVMLFMGWLYAFSGLREVAAELARRKERLPNVKLLIVGDGDLLPTLQRMRVELALEKTMFLVGRRPVSEMRNFIGASDVCLLPSQRVETMEYIVPAKVIEYMELGKPMICTRLPGLEEEFGAIPGILCIEKPEQTLDRIEELLRQSSDPRATARELGATCLELMRRREGWDAVTKRFEQVLRTTQSRAAVNDPS